MKFSFSYKQILILLLISFVITSGMGILVSSAYRPFDLYIRLKEITWPPPLEEIIQGETNVLYGVPMTFEIWNPTNKIYVYQTPNSNLLDPQMEIQLDDNYPFVEGYIYWITFTTHEIGPGTTERDAIMGIEVENYNSSTPPSGNYVVFTDIYGDSPFTIKAYKTIIEQLDNGISIIKYAKIPKKWGSLTAYYRKISPIFLWTFAGGELIAIFLFYKKRKRGWFG